jgi:hypothetical protein
MSKNVAKFPISQWQRILNRRGNRSVHCVVSNRYWRYDHPGPIATGYFPDGKRLGTPVVLEIMSSNDPDLKDRKICDLVVTLEELREMIAVLDREAAISNQQN